MSAKHWNVLIYVINYAFYPASFLSHPMWVLKAAKLCSALLSDYKKTKFSLFLTKNTYFLCLILLKSPFFYKKHIFSLLNFPQKVFLLTKKHVFSLFNFPQKSFFLTKHTYFLCLISTKVFFF